MKSLDLTLWTKWSSDNKLKQKENESHKSANINI